jgi:hypothetical protein
VLNAVKQLAGVPSHIPLLAPGVIESVAKMKKDVEIRHFSTFPDALMFDLKSAAQLPMYFA